MGKGRGAYYIHRWLSWVGVGVTPGDTRQIGRELAHPTGLFRFTPLDIAGVRESIHKRIE